MKNHDKLIDEHKRLIESEAAKYAMHMPGHVVAAEAYRLAHDAADNFDPASGNKFSTYLTHALKKLSRFSTTYGATVRLPEDKQFKLNRLNHIEKNLEAELGRPPTLNELAEVSGWPLALINNLLQNRKRDVNINSLTSSPVFIENNNDEWVHFVYHDLPERDKIIFEHKTGFGGKPVMENEELAKKLGVTSATISNRVKLMSEKIAEGWKE